MAELLDQLHVDVKAEVDNNLHREDDDAQEVPVEPAASAVQPHIAEQEQQESITANGACAIPAEEPTESPGSSGPTQEAVQPPDLTSSVGQNHSDGAVVEQGDRPADILDQVSLTDRQVDLDASGPLKPPRQFTVEPDIVASTKKPPSRPPPPSGGPPPRPPPPSWQNVPSKKSQESLRLSGLEGRELNNEMLKMILSQWGYGIIYPLNQTL